MTATSFECNTTGQTFRGTAAAVARVAVQWAKLGRQVSAYAVGDDDQGRVTYREVCVTNVLGTTQALRSAR